MNAIKFTIQKKLDGALGRAGTLETPHGVIQTPSFVVVGTKASVKALTPEQVRDAGTQVVLANTYHLYLQPGDELIRDAGGLGNFMKWSGPTMTDSGGFQVFSLGAAYGKEISKVVSVADPSFMIPERSIGSEAPLAKIGNDGVSFKSHLDGSLHYITPEKSIEIQHNLGADIIFAFDECTSPTETERYQEEALSRTHAWAKRSLEHHQKLIANSQKLVALFGIVQGGRSEELRKKSAKILAEMTVEDPVPLETGNGTLPLARTGFDGFGIGGSFAKEDMSTAVKWVNDVLPEDKPRHLLGIGEPEDLFMGVENGVDLFDCVGPTRIARNGMVFTKRGKINLMNAQFVQDFNSIDEGCECYTCLNYTRAYLSHLFRAKEMEAGTLATIHNIYFINKLVSDMRASILDGTFFEFKENFLSGYNK